MAYKVTHVIQRGETLQDIATQQLHDVTRWVELKDLNNLVYPYIVDTNEEKIKDPEHLLTWGDLIALPTDNTLDRIDVNQYSKLEVQEKYDIAMGMDLGLDFLDDNAEDNEAFLTPNKGETDLKVRSGLDNLRQSLRLRLMTRYGSLPYHPNYGTHLLDFVGEKMNPDTVQRIRIELVRTVKTDSRVQEASVDNWKVPDGRNFFGEITVVPRGTKDEFQLFIQLANTGIIGFSW